MIQGLLYPEMMMLAPILLVPVLLHFWRKKQVVEKPWGAMTLLARARNQAKFSKRRQDLWQLILRLLFVLALIVAVATPLIVREESGVERSKVHVILIDRGFASGYLVNGESLLDLAKKKVGGILDNAHSRDRFLLLAYPSGSYSQPRLLTRSECEKRLKESNSTFLPVDMKDELNKLNSEVELARRSRPHSDFYLHWISPFARASLGPSFSDDLHKSFPSQTYKRVELVDLGEFANGNAAVTDLVVDSQSSQSSPLNIQAKIRNFGTKPITDLKISLYVNGEEITTKGASLPGEAEIGLAFEADAPQSRTNLIHVKIESDQNPLDNERRLLWTRKESLDLAVIAKDPNDRRRLLYALQANSKEEIQTQSLDELARSIESGVRHPELLLLHDPQPFSKEEVEKLEYLLKKGISIGVFLGRGWNESGQGTEGRKWLEGLGVVPTEIHELSEPGFKAASPDHPASYPFENELLGQLAATPIWKAWKLSINNTEAGVVYRFKDDSPAVAVIASGNARLFIVASVISDGENDTAIAKTERWSTWYSWPSFLPVIDRLVQWATAENGSAWDWSLSEIDGMRFREVGVLEPSLTDSIKVILDNYPPEDSEERVALKDRSEELSNSVETKTLQDISAPALLFVSNSEEELFPFRIVNNSADSLSIERIDVKELQSQVVLRGVGVGELKIADQAGDATLLYWPFLFAAVVVLAGELIRRVMTRSNFTRRSLVGFALIVAASGGILVYGIFEPRKNLLEIKRPTLIVMRDVSESMSAIQGEEGNENVAISEATLSREQKLKQFLREAESQIQDVFDGFDIEYFTFGDETDRVTVRDSSELLRKLNGESPRAKHSKLLRAIASAITMSADRQVSGVIIHTDGRRLGDSGDLSTFVRTLRELKIPVFVMAHAEERKQFSIANFRAQANSNAFIFELCDIQYQFDASNAAGQEVQVELWEKNGRRPLVIQTVKIAKAFEEVRGTFETRFDSAGMKELEVRIIEKRIGTGGAQRIAPLAIRVSADPIRVLLVGTNANYEYRFLKQFLERTKYPGSSENRSMFDLDSLQLSAADRFFQTDASAIQQFPITQKELDAYDLVFLILGSDVEDPRLDEGELGRLQEYVSGAGGNLFLIGSRHHSVNPLSMRLQELLPGTFPSEATSSSSVSWRVSRFAPSETGARLGILRGWESGAIVSLEDFEVSRPDFRLRDGAWELVRGVGAEGEFTAVAMGMYDRGRVVFQVHDDSYRLGEFPGLYEEYWTSLIQYLAKSKMQAEQDSAGILLEKSNLNEGEILRASILAERIPIDLTRPKAKLSSLGKSDRFIELSHDRENPERLLIVAERLEPGDYDLSVPVRVAQDGVGLSRVSFRVLAAESELANLSADEEVLRGLANGSGGRVWNIDQANEFGVGLPPATPEIRETGETEPLWRTAWFRFAICGLPFLLALIGWLLK